MATVVAQWNAHGLNAHLLQFKNYLVQVKFLPDVICLQETFLKEKNKTPKFDNYNVIRKDFMQHTRGGLAILIKKGINFTILNLGVIENIEIQGIKIKTETGYLEILNTYISPSNKILKTQLEKIFPSKRSLIIGDFNAHNQSWGCTTVNERGKILEEILIEKQLTVLNTGQPTRITPVNFKNLSVIDLAIVTRELALTCKHSVSNNNIGSDHFLSNIVINEQALLEPSSSMHMWNFKKADWKNYKENSQNYITDGILDDNINDTFNNIVESLTSLANESLHTRKNFQNNNNKNRKYKPLPFWNSKCSEVIYKRNRARNKALKSRELKDFVEYKHQEAVVKRTLKTEAKAGWENYCSELTDQTKLRTVWGMARRMSGIAPYSSIPTLICNDKTAETNLEKANLLAQVYANTSSSINYNTKFLDYIKETKMINHDPTQSKTYPDFEIEALNENFSFKELKDAIRSSKINTSPGDDKIPYEIIKHLHKNALKILLVLYNKIWTENQLPDDWHHAIILPILKPSKNATSPESYRPISLTSTICKIMEKLITNRLQWFLEKNQILSKNQSGFRKNKSTVDQILKLQDSILKKLKNKDSVLAVFIDFERAYDMLNIPTLLRKLQSMGINGNIYNWLKNFLSNRTFQVKVGASLSDKFILENGTPQGSIISPLLFLIMINDIPSGLDNSVEMTLFADDSSIYAGHRIIKQLEIKIQNSLNAIDKWCHENGFKISNSKTVGVLFTKKRNVPKIRIKIGSDLIKIDKTAKFLGVIFDNKLSWKPHIEYIINKCKKRMNLMRAISGLQWGASKKALLNIYRALIRSVIEYGDVAYASASKTHLNKLISIQTEALKLCCGAAKGTAAVALQNECGEPPLHLRNLQNSLKLGAKVIGNTSHPMRTIFQPHWTNEFKTRDNKNLSTYQRTLDFFSSFDISYKAPSFPSDPPWLNESIHVDIGLHKSISKRDDNPVFLKLITQEYMSKYNSYTHVYTDGSKADSLVAAAYTVPSLDIDKKLRLCDNSSIYAAELTAIKEAFTWIVDNESQGLKHFAVFSDSLSVLTSLKKSFSNSRPTLLQDTIRIFNQIKMSEVHLIWIPSHVGILGNERADTLAGQSLELPTINSTDYLELQEVFSIIKSYVISKWQKEYDSDIKGLQYKSICPVVDTSNKFIDLSRKKEVQISRLRLGKVNLNERLFLMKKHESGLCTSCQVKENINHLLLHCNKENISNILRDKCKVYNLEFNIRTLLGVGFLQSEVFRLVKLIGKGKVL